MIYHFDRMMFWYDEDVLVFNDYIMDDFGNAHPLTDANHRAQSDYYQSYLPFYKTYEYRFYGLIRPINQYGHSTH